MKKDKDITKKAIRFAERKGKSDEQKSEAYYKYMSERGYDEVIAYDLYQKYYNDLTLS